MILPTLLANTVSTTTLESLLKTLHSKKTGLTKKEAILRIHQHGKNVITEEKPTNWTVEFFKEFLNPLIIILIFAATLSYFTGSVVNATIVITMILISTILNFFQKRHADSAAKKLKEKIVHIVTVIREKEKIDIKATDITIGDILFFNAGDLIPADCRVIESRDFFIDESSLTGESFPIEKISDPLEPKEYSMSEYTNILFSGSSVVSGTAIAVVYGIGKNTEFGKIVKDLSTRTLPNEFSNGIHDFSILIVKATLFIVCAIFMINSILQRDFFESFMFAIAIAVGLTPELLPMVMSVTLGHGSVNMSKKGVIVKNLLSIPDLGSMDILCTDKTGTLTQGQIEIVSYVDIFGKKSDIVFEYGFINSSFQTSISNPLDDAILRFKQKIITGYKKIDEIPFDFKRKKLSVVAEKDGQKYIITKGAPEEILASSTKYWINNKCHPLTKSILKSFQETYTNLSKDGFRTVAISIKKVATVKNHVYSISDEQDLELVGFIAFFDPPKRDVKEVISNLILYGVDLKIITGDNEIVTRKICEELSIHVQNVIIGSELQHLSDTALTAKLKNTTIFARFSPDDKNRIIRLLKSAGHIVGYMGDGINDAPSLKTANIGISVNNAVDVAKESADMILTHLSLKELLDGILEGRRAFGNSMKYIMMGISSNFGNMFSVIGAVVFLPYFPMIPIQILLNNLLYDTSQILIPNDNVDSEYLSKPKKWNMKFIKRFMIVFGILSSIFDYSTFFLLYYGFHSSASVFQTGWFIESLATQTLIIHIIRTRKLPFVQSIASNGLLVSTISIVIFGWLIPFLPFGKYFGFAELSPIILFSIIGIVITYLIFVEFSKRVFYKYNEI